MNIVKKILSKSPKELVMAFYYRLPYKFQKRVKHIVKHKIKGDNLTPVALKKIDEYKGKSIDYIIIHNPYWLGVTAATKELFDNLVPLEEIGGNKDAEELAKKIVEIGVSQVIFSAFNYGWDKLARKLKEMKPDIKLKVFWHGSHSQVIEEINWETNTMVITLHKEGIIDVFGTCKESLVNFYKNQGYSTAFIMNTVRIDEKLKENVKITKFEKQGDYENLKIGLYSANSDWRKNAINQILAISYFKNATIEMIPVNKDLEQLAFNCGLNVTGSDKSLPREELLKRMSKNDINVYVTFSECAPMLPIESMEMGTLCILGNNNHYFKGTKLYDYLVVEREDSQEEIVNKIRYALDNKEEIFKLYKEWKKENDEKSEESVKDFLVQINERAEKITPESFNEDITKEVKIGLYFDQDSWETNIYNQLSAVSMIKNAKVTIYPNNKRVRNFCKMMNINMVNKNEGIEVEWDKAKVLNSMAQNDVNLHVTFVEYDNRQIQDSLRLGVPCITGNNHDLFKGTDMEKVLIVKAEDSPDEIREKIINVLREESI